eukprot:8646403-Pyramimonas_sp.AAC.1
MTKKEKLDALVNTWGNGGAAAQVAKRVEEKGDDESAPVRKRPAAKTSDYESKGWRDRGKDRDFKKLKSAGQIPDFVMHMIDNAPAGQKRSTETA